MSKWSRFVVYAVTFVGLSLLARKCTLLINARVRGRKVSLFRLNSYSYIDKIAL